MRTTMANRLRSVNAKRGVYENQGQLEKLVDKNIKR